MASSLHKGTNQRAILILRGQPVRDSRRRNDFKLQGKLSGNNHYFINHTHRLESEKKNFVAKESGEGEIFSSSPISNDFFQSQL